MHSVDGRAEALAKLGAEVVEGDLLDINTVRPAMEGVDAAMTVGEFARAHADILNGISS